MIPSLPRLLLPPALGCTLFLAASPLARAASLASDNAGNTTVYTTTGTYNGLNGGTGFGVFSVTAGANSGAFIGSSTANGGGGGTAANGIDTGGSAFGLFANSGNQVTANRSFTVGGPNSSAILAPTQTFTLRLDNGNVATGTATNGLPDSVGFNLLNSGGTDRFTFEFIGGGTNYVFNLGTSTNVDTGIPFTSNGLTLAFTQGAANAFTFTVTPNGGTTTPFTGTLAAADISQFQVFNNNAGSGVGSDAFFNNPAIVPEPSASTLTTALGALALGLLVWPRLRRSARRA